MTATIPTAQVEFLSDGVRCAAWLTLPAGAGPHPAVVLVHGLGATHDMMLPQYEQHFAAAGIATLAFDYRCTGESDGQPRQHISTRAQCTDVVAAQMYLATHPAIDATRIGLWGTSLGGMNVVRVAAAREDVAVAVVQCPIVHGPGAARRLGLRAAVRLTSALRHARRVSAPLLVCVCDRESLMDPRYAALVAHRAPRGVARHYDTDHFGIYHPPVVGGALADQTAFLQEHLDVRA